MPALKAITKKLTNSLKRPTVTQASSCSLVVHAAVLSVIFFVNSRQEQQIAFDGKRDSMQLSLAAANRVPPEKPVTIAMPRPSEPVEASPSIREQILNEVVRKPAIVEPERRLDFNRSTASRELSTAPSHKPRAELIRNGRSEIPFTDSLLSRRQLSIAVRAFKPSPETVHRSHSQVALATTPAVTTVSVAGVNDRTPPDFSSNPSPVYPPDAMRQRIEGTVLLGLEVTAEGRVESVTVLRSSGHAILDRSAMETVKKWQGTPAQEANRPVPTSESIPIRFRLN